ncbi:sensor histidine kinase [Lacibacterium aquatile]|uniref:histidine kinase n=1 Tax=Lacibacterium aquatile TaxID=1168082 RepID=A0ABW5DU94_9PROT
MTRFAEKIRYFVLALAVFALGASVMYAVSAYNNYRDLAWLNLQRPAWRLMQTEFELLKFNHAMEMARIAPSDENFSAAELHFDNVWNRIDVTFSALEAPRILAVPEVAQVLNDLRKATEDMAPAMKVLRTDFTALEPSVKRFQVLTDQLHRAVLLVLTDPKYNGLASNRAETIFTNGIIAFFITALVVLAVFLTLFIAEARLSRRALRQAQSALALAEARRAEAAAAQMRTAAALVAAEEASRTKSNFLANMSHELRTPLNAILGFSEIMHQGLFGDLQQPRYKEYVGHIHDSAGHLLSLVDDLLTLGKIEAGGYAPAAGEVDLVSVAQFAADLVGVRATAAHVDLVLLLPDVVPAPIQGDERALRQIALNLATNAVKFTPHGGRVEIKVAARSQEEVALSVSDTGIGIPSEAQAKVFEPFYQVDNVFARRNQGAGLGLALVQSLAAAHGARVELESEPGKGTTVTVLFTVAERAAALQ